MFSSVVAEAIADVGSGDGCGAGGVSVIPASTDGASSIANTTARVSLLSFLIVLAPGFGFVLTDTGHEVSILALLFERKRSLPIYRKDALTCI
jgi:hypothetical protein